MNGLSGRVFSDFKTLHVAITHKVVRGHDLDLDHWVKVACDCDSPALKVKSSIVAVEGVKDGHYKR